MRIEFMPQPAASAVASQVNLFAAPLLSFHWGETAARRDDIVAAIIERRRQSRGMQRTNVGGWHSQRDLPGWPEPAVQELVQWVAAQASEATAIWRQIGREAAPTHWRMDGWANVNPPGGAHNRAHDHVMLNWNWSGCYYVAIAPDDGGCIEFEDRWIGIQTASAADANRRRFRYKPSEGELLLWPSWLSHRVEPHNAAGDRISIAFNLHSPWLERSRFWTHRPGFFWRRMPWLMRPIARLRGGWDQSPGGLPPGFDINVAPRAD